MPDTLKAAFAFGILIFGAALFTPLLVDTTQNDASSVHELEEDETQNVTDHLSINAINIDNGQSEADVTLENLDTLNTTGKHLNVSEEHEFSLSGDTINVTLNSITSNNAATFTVVYPPMFGWDGPPRLFFENMEIVIVLLAAAIIVGSVSVVLK